MKPLIPPDRKQCQAEIIKRNPWVMGGPVTDVVRCANKPTWIAKETKAGTDGRKGSMSLCDDCKVKCEEKMSNIAFKAIKVGRRVAR